MAETVGDSSQWGHSLCNRLPSRDNNEMTLEELYWALPSDLRTHLINPEIYLFLHQIKFSAVLKQLHMRELKIYVNYSPNYVPAGSAPAPCSFVEKFSMGGELFVCFWIPFQILVSD